MEPQGSPTPEQQPTPSTEAPTPAPMSSEPMGAPAPQPAMASPAPAGHNPGHGLGVAGLILAFLAPLIGFILSLVAMSKSKKAGMKNGLALAGLIISIINMIVGAIVLVVFFAGAATLVEKCNELGSGTHYVDGVTYDCGYLDE